MDTTTRTPPRLAALALALAPAFTAGCNSITEGDVTITHEYNFVGGALGWEAGFADYEVGTEDQIAPTAEIRTLPPPLDAAGTAFFLSGTNRSDDLFMYLKRPVAGLRPNATYRVRFAVELATNAPSGCMGVGGAPGESVVVKAGATTVEPTRSVDELDHYRLDVDKGDQTEGGREAIVLGHIGNSSNDCQSPEGVPYELKALDSGPSFLEVESTADGGAWLLVGTESGFEATTALYYTRIIARFEPR